MRADLILSISEGLALASSRKSDTSGGDAFARILNAAWTGAAKVSGEAIPAGMSTDGEGKVLLTTESTLRIGDCAVRRVVSLFPGTDFEANALSMEEPRDIDLSPRADLTNEKTGEMESVFTGLKEKNSAAGSLSLNENEEPLFETGDGMTVRITEGEDGIFIHFPYRSDEETASGFETTISVSGMGEVSRDGREGEAGLPVLILNPDMGDPRQAEVMRRLFPSIDAADDVSLSDAVVAAEAMVTPTVFRTNEDVPVEDQGAATSAPPLKSEVASGFIALRLDRTLLMPVTYTAGADSNASMTADISFPGSQTAVKETTISPSEIHASDKDASVYEPSRGEPRVPPIETRTTPITESVALPVVSSEDTTVSQSPVNQSEPAPVSPSSSQEAALVDSSIFVERTTLPDGPSYEPMIDASLIVPEDSPSKASPEIRSSDSPRVISQEPPVPTQPVSTRMTSSEISFEQSNAWLHTTSDAVAAESDLLAGETDVVNESLSPDIKNSFSNSANTTRNVEPGDVSVNPDPPPVSGSGKEVKDAAGDGSKRDMDILRIFRETASAGGDNEAAAGIRVDIDQVTEYAEYPIMKTRVKTALQSELSNEAGITKPAMDNLSPQTANTVDQAVEADDPMVENTWNEKPVNVHGRIVREFRAVTAENAADLVPADSVKSTESQVPADGEEVCANAQKNGLQGNSPLESEHTPFSAGSMKSNADTEPMSEPEVIFEPSSETYSSTVSSSEVTETDSGNLRTDGNGRGIKLAANIEMNETPEETVRIFSAVDTTPDQGEIPVAKMSAVDAVSARGNETTSTSRVISSGQEMTSRKDTAGTLGETAPIPVNDETAFVQMKDLKTASGEEIAWKNSQGQTLQSVPAESTTESESSVDIVEAGFEFSTDDTGTGLASTGIAATTEEPETLIEIAQEESRQDTMTGKPRPASESPVLSMTGEERLEFSDEDAITESASTDIAATTEEPETLTETAQEESRPDTMTGKPRPAAESPVVSMTGEDRLEFSDKDAVTESASTGITATKEESEIPTETMTEKSRHDTMTGKSSPAPENPVSSRTAETEFTEPEPIIEISAADGETDAHPNRAGSEMNARSDGENGRDMFVPGTSRKIHAVIPETTNAEKTNTKTVWMNARPESAEDAITVETECSPVSDATSETTAETAVRATESSIVGKESADDGYSLTEYGVSRSGKITERKATGSENAGLEQDARSPRESGQTSEPVAVPVKTIRSNRINAAMGGSETESSPVNTGYIESLSLRENVSSPVSNDTEASTQLKEAQASSSDTNDLSADVFSQADALPEMIVSDDPARKSREGRRLDSGESASSSSFQDDERSGATTLRLEYDTAQGPEVAVSKRIHRSSHHSSSTAESSSEPLIAAQASESGNSSAFSSVKPAAPEVSFESFTGEILNADSSVGKKGNSSGVETLSGMNAGSEKTSTASDIGSIPGRSTKIHNFHHTAEYEERILNSVVRQARFMLQKGQSSATMLLDPPNLGKMKLDIVTENSKVTGKIFVESSEVQNVIRNNLADLRQTLAQGGLQVESFDVQVGHNGGTDGWANREKMEGDAALMRSGRENAGRVASEDTVSGIQRRSGTTAGRGLIDVWM